MKDDDDDIRPSPTFKLGNRMQRCLQALLLFFKFVTSKQKNILFQELVRFWVAYIVNRWRQREYGVAKAKKCTKKCDARAEKSFFFKTFFTLLLPSLS